MTASNLTPQPTQQPPVTLQMLAIKALHLLSFSHRHDKQPFSAFCGSLCDCPSHVLLHHWGASFYA